MDDTGRRLQLTGQDAQEGGFSLAVRANKADAVADGNGEMDPLEHIKGAVGHGETMRSEK
jgi:hypothetical protein